MNGKLEQAIDILKKWEGKSKKLLSNGTLQICHVPHVGCEAWFHILHFGLSDKQIEELQAAIPVPLPAPYKEFLSLFNGINIFSDSLSIWGLRTLNYRTGEASVQPYSLVETNIYRSKIIPDSWLYIGFYSWDGSEVVIDLDNGPNHYKIYRCKHRDTVILNEWSDFWTWLLSEAQRLSEMYDENGVPLDKNIPTTPNKGV